MDQIILAISAIGPSLSVCFPLCLFFFATLLCLPSPEENKSEVEDGKALRVPRPNVIGLGAPPKSDSPFLFCRGMLGRPANPYPHPSPSAFPLSLASSL
jgi:hypothetical protein